MIFLIRVQSLSRPHRHVWTFDDSQRQEAQDARLEIELDLNRKGVGHEVVLLESGK